MYQRITEYVWWKEGAEGMPFFKDIDDSGESEEEKEDESNEDE